MTIAINLNQVTPPQGIDDYQEAMHELSHCIWLQQVAPSCASLEDKNMILERKRLMNAYI